MALQNKALNSLNSTSQAHIGCLYKIGGSGGIDNGPPVPSEAQNTKPELSA